MGGRLERVEEEEGEGLVLTVRPRRMEEEEVIEVN